jgi:hypothetical protein
MIFIDLDTILSPFSLFHERWWPASTGALKSLKTKVLKVSQLLLQYLLNQHSVQLEGLGTFRLDVPPAGFLSEKGEVSIPPGSIVFEPNPHAPSDAGFISYFAEQTGKMKPLAISDMESYTENGRQLLNIAKPFVIDQVGVLRRNALNELEFTQGEILLDKEEQVTKKAKRAMESDVTVLFDDNYLRPRKDGNSRPQLAGIIGLVLLGIGLLGWVSWFFYNRSVQGNEGSPRLQSPPAVEIKEPALDTTIIKPAVTAQDSLATPVVKVDSIQQVPPSALPQQADFSVVILVANRERAQRRYDSLTKWGHHVVLSTKDSVQYKIAIPIHAPLSDSIRYRDSLSLFFGRKVWIETK